MSKLNDSISAVKRSLDATNVLSDSYKSMIMAYVYAICQDAYEMGKQDERKAQEEDARNEE